MKVQDIPTFSVSKSVSIVVSPALRWFPLDYLNAPMLLSYFPTPENSMAVYACGMDEILQAHRAKQVWDRLVLASSEKRTLSYDDLAKHIGAHHRTLKYPLEKIKVYCAEKSLPPLTTLVVGKRTGKPGAGNGIPEVKLEEEKTKVLQFDWTSLQNPFSDYANELKLRDLFAEVAIGWADYAQLKAVSKSHSMHELVTGKIPLKLRSFTNYSSRYKSIGSDGQGNITPTPWAATFDLKTTDTSQSGYYLVYLISSDLKTLVLSVAFGATYFEAQFGSGRKLYDALADAVKGMRASSVSLVSKLDKKVSPRISGSKPLLDVFSNSTSLKAYEECSIFHIAYDLQELPDEQVLEGDFLELLKLYGEMTGSILLPEPEDFVLEQMDHSVLAISGEKEFKPRSFKTRISAGNSTFQREKPRRSKNADAIGRLGEQQVFEWEKKKLSQAGREDLARKVIWHRDEAENRTPGWDITSYELDGSEIYVEVKSSTQKQIKDVELTPNEWDQAEKNSGNGKYRIYLVSDALKKPTLEVVKDPHLLVSKAEFMLSVSSYQLKLGSVDNASL